MARPPSRAAAPQLDLEDLARLSDPELSIHWRAIFKQAPPPGSRRDFLWGSLAYHLQQQAAGGLKPQAQKTLREVARGLTQGSSTAPMSLGPLKPGTRLLRTWQGESHEVLVLEKRPWVTPRTGSLRRETMATHARGRALPADARKALRSVSEDLKALDRMNLKELQTKFLLLYGVETHSKNPTFLRKKLAWKIQEMREGGFQRRRRHAWRP